MLALVAERLKGGFDLHSLADGIVGWLARVQESWEDKVKFISEGLGNWKATAAQTLSQSPSVLNSVTSKQQWQQPNVNFNNGSGKMLGTKSLVVM